MTSNSAKYQSRNPLKRFLLNRFLHKISSIVLKLRFDNLLDAGCAEGYFLDYFKKKRVLKGKKIIGIDIEKSKLQQAKKLNPEMIFQTVNVYDLKFSDQEFDLVLALELLEHLEKPEDGLKELWRVTKKTLVLSVPNEPMFTILRGGKLNEHINYWNEGKFQTFIKNNINQKAIIYKSVPWLIAIISKSEALNPKYETNSNY